MLFSIPLTNAAIVSEASWRSRQPKISVFSSSIADSGTNSSLCRSLARRGWSTFVLDCEWQSVRRGQSVRIFLPVRTAVFLKCAKCGELELDWRWEVMEGEGDDSWTSPSSTTSSLATSTSLYVADWWINYKWNPIQYHQRTSVSERNCISSERWEIKKSVLLPTGPRQDISGHRLTRGVAWQNDL